MFGEWHFIIKQNYNFGGIGTFQLQVTLMHDSPGLQKGTGLSLLAEATTESEGKVGGPGQRV